MQANLGSNPSFVWRSLCWGRELLREGLKWGVVNGRSIDASSRNWFGSWGVSGDFSCRRPNGKVANYILPNGVWNEGLIWNDFLPHDVVDILNTPIDAERRDDYRFWSLHPKGTYTVKSGYAFWSEQKFRKEHEEMAEGSGKNNKWWKSIWSLQVPPKIKHFLWQLVWNIIPTEWNLASIIYR